MRVRHHPPSFLDIAAVQERTAQMMAQAVHEAEAAGRADSAQRMLTLVYRCRVHAEALKAQALAQKPPREGRLR